MFAKSLTAAVALVTLLACASVTRAQLLPGYDPSGSRHIGGPSSGGVDYDPRFPFGTTPPAFSPRRPWENPGRDPMQPSINLRPWEHSGHDPFNSRTRNSQPWMNTGNDDEASATNPGSILLGPPKHGLLVPNTPAVGVPQPLPVNLPPPQFDLKKYEPPPPSPWPGFFRWVTIPLVAGAVALSRLWRQNKS